MSIFCWVRSCYMQVKNLIKCILRHIWFILLLLSITVCVRHWSYKSNEVAIDLETSFCLELTLRHLFNLEHQLEKTFQAGLHEMRWVVFFASQKPNWMNDIFCNLVVGVALKSAFVPFLLLPLSRCLSLLLSVFLNFSFHFSPPLCVSLTFSLVPVSFKLSSSVYFLLIGVSLSLSLFILFLLSRFCWHFIFFIGKYEWERIGE